MAEDFHSELIRLLPKMRIWALALTRNRAAAEDLTQDVAAKALTAKDCFTPGTNFSAWVHRIMVNHFISGVRIRREYTSIDTVPEVPVAAAHEDRIALRELGRALERLPRDQRDALQMIGTAGAVLRGRSRGHRLRDRHIEEPGPPGTSAVARISHRRADGRRSVVFAFAFPRVAVSWIKPAGAQQSVSSPPASDDGLPQRNFVASTTAAPPSPSAG